jgi:hypothetical protein
LAVQPVDIEKGVLNMKKRSVISVVALAILVHVQVIAQSDNDFDVLQLRDGTLAITAYNGDSSHVIFPAKLFGVDVSEIRFYRFPKIYIKSLVIENGIKIIASGSFANFLSTDGYSFPDIVLPDSILEIGNRAFYRSLSVGEKGNLQLSNRLKKIGEEAFAGEARGYWSHIYVKSIIFPNSIEYVGRRAFANLSIDYIKIEKGFDVEESRSGNSIFSGSIIRCVEMRADLSDRWLNSVFYDQGFINFYISQGRRANIYINNGKFWTIGTRNDVERILSE